MLDVTIDSAKYEFVDVDTWRCTYPSGSRSQISCSLPYLDTLADRTIPLELKLKPGTSIPSDVDSITMGLKLRTQCSSQQGVFLLDRNLTVPVVHHWYMTAVQSPDQSGKIISWNSEDEDDGQATQAFLSYDVKNTGPSMTAQSTIFVYIPSAHSSRNLLKDVSVTYVTKSGGVPCTIGDKGEIQRPLPHATKAEVGTKV